MQNGAEDIKVLPEEGLSVEIGGETYNPAFPRFSCQIIIFCQIMIGNKSYLRRRLRPTEKRFLISTFVVWRYTSYNLCSKGLIYSRPGKNHVWFD